MEDMLAPTAAEEEYKRGVAAGAQGNLPAPTGRPPKPAGKGWVWSDMQQKWILPSPPPPGGAPTPGQVASLPAPAEVQQLAGTFSALAPDQNKAIDSVTNQAKDIQSPATVGVNNAEDILLAPATTPVVNDPRNVKVSAAPGPVPASTSASGAQYDRALEATGGFAGVQDAQQAYLDQLRNQAAGKGPSVAGDMMRAAGVENAATTEKAVADANAQYGEHSREATDAYGKAATDAALAYANASGDQAAEFEKAAMTASQETRRAAENAIRQQAGFVAAARGGQLGAAILNAQNNAAFTMQSANQNITDQRAQQQRAAAAQAAATARQAAYGQATQAATTGRLQSTADAATVANQQQAAIASNLIKAKADIEAGRVLSEEQIAALNQLGVGIKDLQGMTNDEVMAQVNIGNLGAGIDAAVTGTMAANADRDLAARGQDIGAQQFDIGQETGVATGNADREVNLYGIDTQAATSVLNTQAGREAMALAAQGDMAALAAQLNMTEAELGATLFSAAQGMSLEYDKMDRAERQALISGIMSGGATLGAAALMNGGKS